MTRIKYPCYSLLGKPVLMPDNTPPIPCERRAKKGDMWACPHLLAGGTWENCEAGNKAKAPISEDLVTTPAHGGQAENTLPAEQAGVKE